ncbi:MAG: 23S rRNA (uracil(1939)-C(5))-methyltransferase RlmD [Clostridia bacterium]|nr:23S rRNA (uracil(1939)-C(5))-methyltransferase RlmD [Clostridia bacterium]
MALKKNDEIELYIDSVSLTGSGIGRHDGMAVFVPACAKGDRLLVHIIKVKKSYAVGKALKVLSLSSDRVQNNCAAFPSCGGCAFRHMSYEAELQLKYEAVRDAFKRIGGINIEPKSIIGSKNMTGYRNKAQYPVRREGNEVKIGFYAQRSHRVIDSRDCSLAPKEFETILNIFADWIEKHNVSVYDEVSGRGLLRHIYIRKAFETGEIMVCPVSSGKKLPKTDELIEELLKAVPAITSVVLNVNSEDTNVVLGKECITLYGKGYITDILCGVKVRISPLSFYQVNRAQAQRLYEKAAEYAAPKKDTLMLDLYCGAGTIGLSMADKVGELIGVETVPQAVEDAKLNAKENGITNAEFICADAGEAAQMLLQQGKKPDVIILDPPRKGCSAETISAAVGMKPERIVYVSCDPATLARDCAEFEKLGYFVREVTPVDMFPRTAHVESVAWLSK